MSGDARETGDRRLTILIINRFYRPDESSSSLLATDMAEHLARRGHEVHVVCARLMYDRPEQTLSARETINGVHIHRLASTRFGRSGTLSRLCDLATFQLSLHWTAPRVCRPDLVVPLTDPPMVITAGVLVRLLRRATLVHYVFDVYPDILTAVSSTPAARAAAGVLDLVYRVCLRSCEEVLTLGERMSDRMARKGADRERMAALPPWSAGSDIRPIAHEENPFRRELDLPADAIVVMYSGNMGRAHNFDGLLEGMRAFRDDPRFHFLFVGGGARKAQIESAVADHPGGRARCLPYQPREALVHTLTAADVHLICQMESSLGLIVPSKLSGILAAGRPSIYCGVAGSEIDECLRDHDCGLRVDESDGAAFARELARLADDPALRARMGENARRAFEADYDRDRVLEKIEARLLAALSRSTAGR